MNVNDVSNGSLLKTLSKRPEEYLHFPAPDTKMWSGEAFSLMLFFFPENSHEGILCGQEPDWSLALSDGHILFTGSNGYILSTNGSWFLGCTVRRWYHVAVCRDNTGMKLYIDGCLVAVNDKTLVFGAAKQRWQAGKNFAGSIRDMRLYERCFTQQELLFARIFLPKEPLSLYLPLRDALADQGRYHLPISVSGLPGIVNTAAALEFCGEGGCCFPVKAAAREKFSIVIPICPKRSENMIYPVYSEYTEDLTKGFSLYLKKTSDNRLTPYIEILGLGELAASEIATDSWCLLSVIYDGTIMQIGVDGTFASNTLTVSKENLSGNMITYFGCDTSKSGSNYFTGYFACVGEYNRALTEQELSRMTQLWPEPADYGITALYRSISGFLTDELSGQRAAFTSEMKACCSFCRNLEAGIPPAIVYPSEPPKEWNTLSETQMWETDFIGDLLRVLFTHWLPLWDKSVPKNWQRFFPSLFLQCIQGKSYLDDLQSFLLLGVEMDSSKVLKWLAGLIGNGMQGIFRIAVLAFYRIHSDEPDYDMNFLLSYLPDCMCTAFFAPADQGGMNYALEKIRLQAFSSMSLRPPNVEPQRVHISLVSIRYAFPDDNDTNSIFIRRDGIQAHKPPEWREDSSKERPALAAWAPLDVWQPKIQVKLYILFAVQPKNPVTIELYGDDLCDGILGCVKFSFPAQKSETYLLETRLSIPEDKTKIVPYSEQGGWYWKVKDQNGLRFLCNSYHTLYLCLERPGEPWYDTMDTEYDEQFLYYPWVNAMDAVIDNLMDHGSNESLAKRMVCLMNRHNGFIYDINDETPHYVTTQGEAYLFDLHSFLTDCKGDGKHLLSSADTAMAVATLCNLFGNILRITQIYETKQAFACNPVIPLGFDKFTVLPKQWEHWFNYLYLKYSTVYDASMCLDGGDYPQNEVQNFEKIILEISGIDFAEEKDREVNITQPYKKIVYKERFIAQGQNFEEMRKITAWWLKKPSKS